MVRISKTWSIIKCRYGHVIWYMKYYYMIRSYGYIPLYFHCLPSIFPWILWFSVFFNVSPAQNSQRNQGADRSNQSSLCSASLLLERPCQRPDGLQRLQTLAFFWHKKRLGASLKLTWLAGKSPLKGDTSSSMVVFPAIVMSVFEGVTIP